MGFVKPNPDAEPNDTVKAPAVVTCQQQEATDTSSCDTDSPNPSSEDSADELQPDDYAEDPLVTTDPSDDLVEEEPDRQNIAEFDLDDSLFSLLGQERQVLIRSQKRAAPADAETPPVTF